ncbi:hypothetical protein [Clostridium chauvoei]|nr:hypothetical protein [Clostridium chauvoei]ATD55768.1 hypothetical protein BTM20_11195 [Clostridium chauvoei]ATD56556.1 hypothetical protein BTM21_01825 [Clostridium chauvoei]MBX7280313.1 hypothetical protein [Clostridium chauvoei]MBX7282798.1 hypothetical protein [Clostridium chauvoei]MBX7285204.1 hypothetical protein [Clostridium chauvoei]
MDKYDYIEGIMIAQRGITGINYQKCLRDILKRYYKYKNKTYEMPDAYGGDDKNDGWVVEDALFYQVFAPTRLKESLRKEMQNKFSDDLEGLIKKVYKEGKWNGQIKKFIFLVSTFDGDLPHDSERFFENKVNDLKRIYNISFDYEVTNGEYIRDILYEIEDIKVLEQISSQMRIRGLIDYNAITEELIINLIDEIAGNIITKYMTNDTINTYNRVSSPRKIEINKLDEKKDEIEAIIEKLDIVENAINTINQDILSEDRFERVKGAIIRSYSELCSELSGVELYDKIIEEALKFTNNKSGKSGPVKFLIVYVFDKCDIFEKE